MEYIKEHLYITSQGGIYFLNADDGYKFYDTSVDESERTYWIQRSIGFNNEGIDCFDIIDVVAADTLVQKYAEMAKLN